MYECRRGKLHDENHSDEGECYFCNMDEWVLGLEKRLAELEAGGVVVIEARQSMPVAQPSWGRPFGK